MLKFPDVALSVRQPWAWAIIHAGKDRENRSRAAIHYMQPVHRWVAIHASKGMTRDEYEAARSFMKERFAIECPRPDELLRGGIIGTTHVYGSTVSQDSKWFMGPCALMLRDSAPCDFIPCQGQLGYFRPPHWDNRIGVPLTGEPPLRWMAQWGRETKPQMELL